MADERTGRLKLSASIMCANLLDLGGDIAELKGRGIDYLHFDLMDGHFVPEIGLGLGFLEQIARAGHLPVDVHLMVTDPGRFIEPVVRAGASIVCIHQEIDKDVRGILRSIRANGAMAGLALRPETDLASVLPLLDFIDMVLLMAYAPGTRNQRPVPGFERRVSELQAMVRRQKRARIDIAVDGGVSEGHLRVYRDAGASFFILGTSGLFIPGTRLAEQVDRVRKILDERTNSG